MKCALIHLRRHFVKVGSLKINYWSIFKNLGKLFLSLQMLELLVFQLAKKAGVSHRFHKVTDWTGWDWLKRFREPNSSISLRS